MEKEIELKFIEQTLQQYGARLKSALIKEISDKNLISKNGTAHLKNNIRYDVSRTGMSGYQLNLYFPDHGRYIEIRYHKGRPSDSELAFKPKKGSGSKSASATLTKIAQSRKNGTRFSRKNKDTRWYSKTAYGSLNSLIGQLMYGLTDAVQETLKEQLNQSL